jgi:hypothetical protein
MTFWWIQALRSQPLIKFPDYPYAHLYATVVQMESNERFTVLPPQYMQIGVLAFRQISFVSLADNGKDVPKWR